MTFGTIVERQKGVKGLYNIGVGHYDSEGEITSLPGQRYMILNKGKENGKPKFTILVLPPDPDYIANISKKKGAK